MMIQLSASAHDHVFLGSSHDRNTKRTLWVVAITAVMMVAEIVAGLLFNSMALLADGFHMATHAGALGVAAGAYMYAKKHAHSRRYSFGTGKVCDLAGFASALVLGFVALGIGFESIKRLLDPTPVAFGSAAVIAIIGLVVNVVSALLLGGSHHHDSDHNHHHHHESDNNLRSAYVHVVADALTSVLAIAALLGGRYLGWIWLDPVSGMAGGVVIGVWSWSLMRSAAAVLLDASDLELEREVREHIEGPGDTEITDLHVWRVGPSAHAAIVSVTGADRSTVEQRLAPVHEIAHLTVDAK